MFAGTDFTSCEGGIIPYPGQGAPQQAVPPAAVVPGEPQPPSGVQLQQAQPFSQSYAGQASTMSTMQQAMLPSSVLQVQAQPLSQSYAGQASTMSTMQQAVLPSQGMQVHAQQFGQAMTPLFSSMPGYTLPSNYGQPMVLPNHMNILQAQHQHHFGLQTQASPYIVPPQPNIVNVTHVHHHTIPTSAPAMDKEAGSESGKADQAGPSRSSTPLVPSTSDSFMIRSSTSDPVPSTSKYPYVSKVVSIKEIRGRAKRNAIEDSSDDETDKSESSDLSSDFECKSSKKKTRPLALTWKKEEEQEDDPAPKRKGKSKKAQKPNLKESASRSPKQTRSRRAASKKKREQSPEFCAENSFKGPVTDNDEIITVSDDSLPEINLSLPTTKEEFKNESSDNMGDQCAICLDDMTFKERAQSVHEDPASTCQVLTCAPCVTKWLNANQNQCFLCHKRITNVYVVDFWQ